jgi:hypothetical protein
MWHQAFCLPSGRMRGKTEDSPIIPPGHLDTVLGCGTAQRKERRLLNRKTELKLRISRMTRMEKDLPPPPRK